MLREFQQYLIDHNPALGGRVFIDSLKSPVTFDNTMLPGAILKARSESGIQENYTEWEKMPCGSFVINMEASLFVFGCFGCTDEVKQMFIGQILTHSDFKLIASGSDAADIYYNETGELLRDDGMDIIRIDFLITKYKTIPCVGVGLCADNCC